MDRTKRILSAGAVCLFGAMACFYLAAIVYINLSVTPGFYITDMYTDVMVAMEMWAEKSLFPQTWTFGNQLYVAATPVLAALIYGITGNAFRSMGAASCVMAVLVIASFDWMLRPVFRKLGTRLFAIAAFLALVVLFGDAVLVMNGWQLLFTMCSYYACYAVNVFLAFGCYIRSRERISVVMTVITCLLSFAMGIQSLRQTAVMVLPLAGMEALELLRRLRQKKPVFAPSTGFTAAIAVSNACGLIAKEFLKVRQVSIFGEIAIAAPAEAVGAVWESVKNAWALFARDTAYPNGTFQTVLLLFLLTALAVYLYRAAGETREVHMLMGLLSLSVLAIFAADVFTTMNVRSIYYFMTYPLVACLGAWLFGLAPGKHSALVKTAMTALLCLAFSLSCTREVLPVCRQVYDRTLDRSYAISRQLQEEGYTTVYSSWNFCERLAVASWGKLEAGFWTDDADPFIPVKYLCSDRIYDAEGSETVYLFRTEEGVRAGIEKAAAQGIRLTPVAEYPEEHIYIYTAPVNLLEIFG